jgi:hypothetical protein
MLALRHSGKMRFQALLLMLLQLGIGTQASVDQKDVFGERLAAPNGFDDFLNGFGESTPAPPPTPDYFFTSVPKQEQEKLAALIRTYNGDEQEYHSAEHELEHANKILEDLDFMAQKFRGGFHTRKTALRTKAQRKQETAEQIYKEDEKKEENEKELLDEEETADAQLLNEEHAHDCLSKDDLMMFCLHKTVPSDPGNFSRAQEMFEGPRARAYTESGWKNYTRVKNECFQHMVDGDKCAVSPYGITAIKEKMRKSFKHGAQQISMQDFEALRTHLIMDCLRCLPSRIPIVTSEIMSEHIPRSLESELVGQKSTPCEQSCSHKLRYKYKKPAFDSICQKYVTDETIKAESLIRHAGKSLGRWGDMSAHLQARVNGAWVKYKDDVHLSVCKLKDDDSVKGVQPSEVCHCLQRCEASKNKLFMRPGDTLPEGESTLTCQLQHSKHGIRHTSVADTVRDIHRLIPWS